MFNPESTFESFLTGTHNNFACAAAKAVAETPGKSYNPLLIYGGAGSGKTHLLHAIGQHAARKHRGARVAYLSAEQFVGEFIAASQNNQADQFRAKYLQLDVLLIDDIQYLAGQERLQDEFYHTFNALHEAHQQIVMACGGAPSERQGIEARLVHRFEWGLVTDLQPPDAAMRLTVEQAT